MLRKLAMIPDKKRIAIALLLGWLLWFGIFLDMARADRTIFFDDFTSKGFPSQWTNVSTFDRLNQPFQDQGQLILTETSRPTSIGGITYLPVDAAVIANSSAPVISSSTAEGQFIFMSFKVDVSNLTTSLSLQRNGTLLPGRSAAIYLGLHGNIICGGSYTGMVPPVTSFCGALSGSDALPGRPWFIGNGGNVSFVGFIVEQMDNPTLYGRSQRFAAYASIIYPEQHIGSNATGTCYGGLSAWGGTFPTNGCNFRPIPLTSADMPFEPGPHYYNMQMRLFPSSKQSWIAFQIDAGMWHNITQANCHCIDGPLPGASQYRSMYPFIGNTYCGQHPDGCAIFSQAQSLGTAVDYVLVTDFVPPELPAGQLYTRGIPSGGKPTTPDLLGWFQYLAVLIAPDNPGFGGSLMSLVFVFAAVGVTLIAGIRVPFIIMLETLVMILLTYAIGILPFWIAVVSMVIAIGIMAGVVKADLNMGQQA